MGMLILLKIVLFGPTADTAQFFLFLNFLGWRHYQTSIPCHPYKALCATQHLLLLLYESQCYTVINIIIPKCLWYAWHHKHDKWKSTNMYYVYDDHYSNMHHSKSLDDANSFIKQSQSENLIWSVIFKLNVQDIFDIIDTWPVWRTDTIWTNGNISAK